MQPDRKTPLGAFIPLAVVLALLMLGAARIVGSASAR